MTKEVLERYIANRLSSGDTLEDIFRDLLSRGYSQEEVNEASTGARKSPQKKISLNTEDQKQPDNNYKSTAAFKSDIKLKPEKAEFKKIAARGDNKYGALLKFPGLLVKLKEFKESFNIKMNKIIEHKQILALATFCIFILLAAEYLFFKRMDSLPKTIIVGTLYFLIFFGVIFSKAGIIKAVFSSSRKQNLPGFFKEILGIVTGADAVMLLILPFTLSISLGIIIGTIFFTVFAALLLDSTVDEMVVNVITYALFNVLILILIKRVITPEFIITLFMPR